jgi:hypothetical protein
VYALGFVSVFDQILDGFDAGDKEALFGAYVRAIGEDPAQYRVSGWGQVQLRRAQGTWHSDVLVSCIYVAGEAWAVCV